MRTSFRITGIDLFKPTLLCLALLLLHISGPFALSAEAGDAMPWLTAKIPARQPDAITGSEFAGAVAGMTGRQRELAIVEQLLQGNIPEFLRKLKPVHFQYQPADSKAVSATIFVMPDYLAIGSDQDFMRFPMNHFAAATAANRFGFILPTKKMVDTIYAQSALRLKPKPMRPGARMRSTAYYRSHNDSIDHQLESLGGTYGQLVAGHKKDVVLTNRLGCDPKRVAIYGWHRKEGAPIQPLSTVHVASYADYSHGTRLVSDQVLINGERRSVYEVLKDHRLSKVFSDEGCIPDAMEILRPFLSTYLAKNLN